MELIKIEVVENERRVDGRELWRFLEIKTEFAKWVDRYIKDFDFIDGQDFSSFLDKSKGGRPSKEYQLSLDMAKELSMLARNDKGKEARKYFIECEKKLKQAPQQQAPQTRLEWIKLALQQEEEKQQLQIEKDYAVRTKAEIGSRREATSMATASKFSKENKKLKSYIGECEDYATILAVERIYKDGGFKWRELKKYCIANELEVKEAPDKRFGKVKSYPAKAWLELYGVELSEIF